MLQKNWFTQYPLTIFFTMSYFLTWVIWTPWILSKNGAGIFSYELSEFQVQIFKVGGMLLGPTFTAFAMTFLTQGIKGLQEFLSRFVRWRVGIQWYLFALLGVPLILFLSSYFALPQNNLSFFELFSIAIGYLFKDPSLFILVFIIGGPLFEEPGWRGFALPRLQYLYGPLLGTFILATLHAFWHLPLYLIPGYNGSGTDLLGVLMPFVAWYISVVATAILMTWVFNNTKESLLIMMLFHAAYNTYYEVMGNSLGIPIVTTKLLIHIAIGFGILALCVIALTQGKLNYKQAK